MTHDWDWDDEVADVKPLKSKKRVEADKSQKIKVSVKQPQVTPEVDFDQVDDFDDMILEAESIRKRLYGDSKPSSAQNDKESYKIKESLKIDPEAFFRPSEDLVDIQRKEIEQKARYQDFKIQSQTAELIFGHMPSIDEKTLKKLKKGAERPTRTIDLHGDTLEQAFERSMSFLHQSYQQGHRLVLITHGKGKGYGQNNDMGIIKSQIHNWLMGHDKVLAFCTALPKDGGAGALYVLLKKNRSTS